MGNRQHGSKSHSVTSRIINLIGLPKNSPDEHAPSIENLEPRVLLSANPLTEAVRYQDNDLLNNQSVIIMPLSTGQNNSIAPLAEQHAIVTILSPEKSAFHNGQIDVKANIVKGDSDISKWTAKLIYEDGRAYTLRNGSGLPTSDHLLTFNSRSYGAGACSIEIEVLDKAGNTTTASQAFKIDIAAPTVSIASPAYNAYQKESFEIIGSVADGDTADEQVSWTLSIKDSKGLVVVVQEGTGKVDKGVLGAIDPKQFVSGNYTLTLDARDAAGNTRSTSLPVRLDGFAPEVTVTSDIQEIDSWQYVTFTIGATDDVGISSRKLLINGATYNVGSNGILRVRLEKAGIFNAIAEVTDAAGNIGRATMQVTVRDMYKPEVALNAPANNAAYNGPGI